MLCFTYTYTHSHTLLGEHCKKKRKLKDSKRQKLRKTTYETMSSGHDQAVPHRNSQQTWLPGGAAVSIPFLSEELVDFWG